MSWVPLVTRPPNSPGVPVTRRTAWPTRRDRLPPRRSQPTRGQNDHLPAYPRTAQSQRATARAGTGPTTKRMPPRHSTPMSAADAPSETAAIRAQSRESLWAIGLSALLVAVGLTRRPVDQRPRRDDRVGEDDRRGRFAEGPSEIPPLGWKDILLRVYNGVSDDRILANAAGVTYYALLALFPGIAALVSIYG